MKFNASTDRMVKMITVATCLLFLFISIVNISMVISQADDLNLLLTMLGTIVFFVAIVLGCYLYAPQSYEITDHELIIERKMKNVVFKIEDIKELRAIEEGEMKGLIRTFGVGGLFGYFGRFHSMGYGSMTFYATQSKNKVLIIFGDDKKVVLTPDDMSMLSAIQAKLK